MSKYCPFYHQTYFMTRIYDKHEKKDIDYLSTGINQANLTRSLPQYCIEDECALWSNVNRCCGLRNWSN